MISKLFKIFKLTILILNICYFLGQCWIVVCMIFADVRESNDKRESEGHANYDSQNNENFMEHYGLWDNTYQHNMILTSYFTLTTLSTVGFGDLAPRSDAERLFGAFILMFGVAIFSKFLGDFIDIIAAYKAINKDIEFFEDLNKFFELIKHFNKDIPINDSFREKVISFFVVKWETDRNQLIADEEDKKILEQIPDESQNDLYCTYLFEKFIKDFSVDGNYFKFEKYVSVHGVIKINKGDPFYSWEDQIYREFMMGVLNMLEPRIQKKGSIIYETVQIV